MYPGAGEERLVDRYALVDSKGWLSGPSGLQLKRKSLWFFAEGSSFTARVEGRVVDVTPEYDPGHRVYRYGLGLYAGSS